MLLNCLRLMEKNLVKLSKWLLVATTSKSFRLKKILTAEPSQMFV